MSSVDVQEVRSQEAVSRGRLHSVAPACVVLYLAVVLGLLFAILHHDDGVFTYALDDPYIHLALAENIAHGHYGINPGEAASPSSSVVWPLLLVPFAGFAWGQYVPLALNVLFCGMAAWGIGRIVDGWDWRRGGEVRARRSVTAGLLEWLGRFAIAAALMLLANLAGLTFAGMEHGLQVLLAVVCAAGMVESFAGRPIPMWCLCAAALGPMVRYENFVLVGSLAVVLWGQRRWGTALRLGVASVVGPLLFSLFLVSRGLPALPSSVLVKANAYAVAGVGLIASLKQLYWRNPGGTVRELAWWGQLLVAVVLLCLADREKQRVRRSVLGGALLAAVVQLAVGHFNWFHRYEVFVMAFTALVAATALVETTRIWRIGLVAALLSVGIPYCQALLQTREAASNVYQQQYQMHRFVADFYRKPVAVNDIGWVSYRRPAGMYVLDLWGLASPQASRQVHKNVDWLETITTEHQTGLAILYPRWYEEGAPEEWDELATMCITGRRISVGLPCVVFYRTEVGDEAALTAEMAAFARTLPASVKMTLAENSADGDK